MIFLGLGLAFAAVVGGTTMNNEKLQKEWRVSRGWQATKHAIQDPAAVAHTLLRDRWMAKDHRQLNEPTDHIAPLRTPRGRDRPLWMTDDDMTPADPRLSDCLKFDPEKDNPARKATHWTLRDQGDGDQSRGDGGA